MNRFTDPNRKQGLVLPRIQSRPQCAHLYERAHVICSRRVKKCVNSANKPT
uniref:Uncharacterized protein n=1 Tax=Anguilla anguilla TaxID=7936 RepID=A0A0E9P9S7_ANGAN